MTQEEIDALKRKDGIYRQFYAVVENDDGTRTIDIVTGQTGLSETLTDNLVEVTPVKPKGVTATTGPQWVARESGTKDFTCEVSFDELMSETDANTKHQLLKKLKTKQSSATHCFIGNLVPASGSTEPTIFVGTHWYMLISSITSDAPADGKITGSGSFSNSGVMQPVEYTEATPKTLADILAEIYPTEQP